MLVALALTVAPSVLIVPTWDEKSPTTPGQPGPEALTLVAPLERRFSQAYHPAMRARARWVVFAILAGGLLLAALIPSGRFVLSMRQESKCIRTAPGRIVRVQVLPGLDIEPLTVDGAWVIVGLAAGIATGLVITRRTSEAIEARPVGAGWGMVRDNTRQVDRPRCGPRRRRGDWPRGALIEVVAPVPGRT